MRLVRRALRALQVQREPLDLRVLPARKAILASPDPPDLRVRRELQALPDRQALLGLVLRALRAPQDRQVLPALQVLPAQQLRVLVVQLTFGFRHLPGFPAPLQGVASTP